MASSAKRLYTELKKIKLENDKNPNSKQFLIDETPFDNDDDETEPSPTEKDEYDTYYIVIGRILPTANIYNSSAFKVKFRIPITYPLKPPQVQILTPIYHPNIGPEGKVCIELLRQSGTWRAINNLSDVVKAIDDHIKNPIIENAVSKNIADEYTQNRPEFERKVAEMVQRNMVPRQ